MTDLQIDDMIGYESPIERLVCDICEEIGRSEEKLLMQTVQKVGFNVNKEELMKALAYDRGQYEKGFRDGKAAEQDKKVGEWVVRDDGDCVCSVCGAIVESDERDRHYWRYCYNCGRRMDGLTWLT